VDASAGQRETTWADLGRLLALATAVCALVVSAFAFSEDAARRVLAGEGYSDGVPLHDHVHAWRLLDAKVDLARDSQDEDVLVIGDSTGLIAFMPEIFRRETGLRAVNLATHGLAGTPGCETLLREACRCGSRASRVLLWLHARSLKFSDADIDEMGFASWLRNRADRTFDRGHAVVRANDTWGGLLRYRLLRKRLRRRDVARPDGSPLEELVESRGWLPRHGRGGSLLDVEEPVHPDALAAVARIGRFCERRDLDLDILVNPLVEGSPARPEYLRSIRDALRRAAPEARLVNTLPAFLPRAWFADAGHVYAWHAPVVTRMVGRHYRERERR
jgi:hypothetical protein